MLTPEFRVSYANVFSAQEQTRQDGTKVREFSCVAIFPKGTDLTEMKKAAEKVLIEKFGPDKTKWPTGLRNPFRKCSERWKNEGGVQKIAPGYEDGEAIFVTMKSNEKNGRPGIVDANVQPIIEQHQFYSGCYARASTNPYWYDHKGNRGIGFGLGNLQKIRDGEPLGGRASPTAEFQPVADAAALAGAVNSVFD